MARPKKEFDANDWDRAQALARIHCTQEEICAIMDIDEETFGRLLKSKGYQGFSDWFKKYSAGGKMSLRRQQFKMALEKDSVPMAIWLGKQHLGQRDSFDLEAKIDNTRAFDTSKMSKEEYMELVKSRFKKD